VAYLKNLQTGDVITNYINFNKTQELTLTVQTALDGTEYLTRFGSPVYSYMVEAYVNDAGKELLMQAADTLDELEVSVRLGNFTGRIKSLNKFSVEYYGWYKTTIILSSINEVTNR